MDLLGLDPTPAPPARSAVSAAAPASSPLDFFGAPAPAPAASPAYEVLGSKDGLTIRGALVRTGGKVVLQTVLENSTSGTVSSVGDEADHVYCFSLRIIFHFLINIMLPVKVASRTSYRC